MRDPTDRGTRELPTETLGALVRSEPYGSDSYYEALIGLHLRGGPEEFAVGEALSRSDRPDDRVVAADVLAQLGAGQPTFAEESTAVLRAMLTDPDDRVLRAVGIALGHRRDAAAIPALLALRSHASADVRFGVAAGLAGLEHPDAIAALIGLSRDADLDVRNWATFDLASMVETDTPELRAALLDRTEDDDPEVRGEALIGLAARHDPRVVPALRRELDGEFHGDWCVEAVELLGDASLRDALVALRGRLDAVAAARFERSFEDALRALDAVGG